MFDKAGKDQIVGFFNRQLLFGEGWGGSKIQIFLVKFNIKK